MTGRTQIWLALALLAIAAPARAAEGGTAFAAFRDVCGSADLGSALIEVRLAKAGFRRGSPDAPFPLLAGGELYSRTVGGVRVTASVRHIRKTDGRYWSCGVQLAAEDAESLEDLERWLAVPGEDGVGFGPTGSETIYSFTQEGNVRTPLPPDDQKAVNDAFRARKFRRVYAEVGPSMTTIVVLAAIR